MRIQVILDSSFARPGSAPIWGGKKGEFRDWTIIARELSGFICTSSLTMNEKIQYRTRPLSAVLKISSSLLVNECR